MSEGTRLVLTLGPGKPAEQGDIAVVDWGSGEIIDRFRYRHEALAMSHKGLCGASWRGDRLLVVTEVEILELSAEPLALLRRSTLPFLNDAHHIAANGDRVFVANAGLDTVEELDLDFRIRKTHDLIRRHARGVGYLLELLRDDFLKSWNRWRGNYPLYTHLQRRPAFRNLRKLLDPGCFRRSGEDVRTHDFRPHALHPNHVWIAGDDVWVTLWRPGRIVSLTTGRVLAEGLGHPHDGTARGDEFYVTDCQDNRLYVYRYLRDEGRLGPRLAAVAVTESKDEGFLRGVAVTGDRVYLGLTARRGCRVEQARIRALERGTWKPAGDWWVPEELGRVVFSVLSWDAREHA